MKYDSIIIIGPTASGKTSISIELAKILKTEIVNADSMYIYKNLSIGTAKPTKEEMQGITHHIIDVANPTEKFNVYDYRTVAEKTIANLKDKNLLPVVVGGTGFYIDSLFNNFTYGSESISNGVREKIQADLNQYGKEFIYKQLQDIDPITANKLHVNDAVRVSRALEIILSTGTSKQNIINNSEPILKHPLIVGLDMPRDILYDRINRRVDIMIDNGLIDEIKGLIGLGLNPDNAQSMKGIGYKEMYQYLNQEISLEDAIEKIKQHTRNYAKRQITWFKRNSNINWISVNNKSIDDITKEIINIFNNK